MGRERLHVLFFAPSIGGGGAERHLVRVARHLDPARFRASVAVSRGGGSYEGELGDHVAYHVLGARRMLAAIRPLARLIGAERPDVVCSFLDPANVVALAAARLAGTPAARVLGVQNTVSESLADGVRHGVIRRAIPRLYAGADAVVALAPGVADDLVRLAPGLRGQVRVIPNAGYDDGALAAGREPLEAAHAVSRPLLVACGRLTRQKDHATLLGAFARVRREHPSATLWIVGEGELRGELEADVAARGLSGAVWLPGFQPNPYPFMRAADVFVLSSRWEGFGNVVVEAMALGAPVVATDTHGPRAILEEGVSGLLVPPGDEGRLADALLRLLADPALGRALAAAGAERARAFAAPAVAARYGALFAEVAAARPSRDGRTAAGAGAAR
ncbi:MAG TPA: glycosyltransferase [Longimicrobium sp.]|jgi:glycosyltransferase involved in cell wall biosynthesis|nr:glycosyltransferase [Longimicrobium sp.]